MIDWVEDRSETLDIKDVMKEMNQTSIKQSKMFARTQLSNFNKSLLIASFREAGVNKVKWITAHDRAVRGNPSGLYPMKNHDITNHYNNDGKIFDINNNAFLNEFLTAYNCRCGASAVWN